MAETGTAGQSLNSPDYCLQGDIKQLATANALTPLSDCATRLDGLIRDSFRTNNADGKGEDYFNRYLAVMGMEEDWAEGSPRK